MSKKSVTAVLVAFMFIVVGKVHASSQLGYGSTSCSIFNAIQKEGGVMVASIDSWTLGYLSGLNQAAVASGKSDQLRTHQPKRIAAYIRFHCEANPTQTVAKAVDTYWSRSSEKQTRNRPAV